MGIITLGREAVISDRYKQLDWVMCCFFFTKYSQSRYFRGRLTSLTKLIQSHTDQPVELARAVQDTLQSYLDRFFDGAMVSAQVEDVDDANFNLVLDVDVPSDKTGEAKISMGYALTYESTHLRRILERLSGRVIYNP